MIFPKHILTDPNGCRQGSNCLPSERIISDFRRKGKGRQRENRRIRTRGNIRVAAVYVLQTDSQLNGDLKNLQGSTNAGRKKTGANRISQRVMRKTESVKKQIRIHEKNGKIFPRQEGKTVPQVLQRCLNEWPWEVEPDSNRQNQTDEETKATGVRKRNLQQIRFRYFNIYNSYILYIWFMWSVSTGG